MIFKNAISYRAFSSGGPGGQHQNTTENAIEASLEQRVAVELGIPAVKATSSLKSQHASKKAAARTLRSRIQIEIKKRDHRGRGFDRARVRNYHQPDNRVTDSTGLRWSWDETVGKCRIGQCIDGRRDHIAREGSGVEGDI